MSRTGCTWLAALLATSPLGCTSRGGGPSACGPRVGAARPAAITVRTLAVTDAVARLWPTSDPIAPRPPTLDERAALVRLVVMLADAALRSEPGGAPPPEAAALARAAALELEVWRIGEVRAWVLLEPTDARRGAGAYLFRVGPAAQRPELLLQAPHAYHDVGTGPLALAIFLAPPPGAAPRALFTNTVHRYQLGPARRAKSPERPADVCHNPDHGFTAATAAFAERGPARVIQLHGFAELRAEVVEPSPAKAGGAPADSPAPGPIDGDDDGLAPPAADVVVSAGRRQGSTAASTQIAHGLGQALGVRVLRFPEDTSRLGATTNVQGRALASIAGAEFVHVELGRSLRDHLAAVPELLARFGAALLSPPPGEADAPKADAPKAPAGGGDKPSP